MLFPGGRAGERFAPVSLEVESAVPPTRVSALDEERPARRARPAPRELPQYAFCPEAPDPEASAIRRPAWSLPLDLRHGELVDRAPAILRGEEGGAELQAALSAFLRGDSPRAAVAALAAAPGRVQDGFDVALAAATHAGVRALVAGDDRAASRWADAAVELDPADPVPWLLRALVAQRRGDDRAEREALLAAFERDPAEPGVALAVGVRHVHTPELEVAARALDAYLGEHPEDVALGAVRRRLDIRIDLTRSMEPHARGGLVVLAPPEHEELGRSLLDGVDRALDRAALLLGAPRRPELTVTLYAARSDMRAATCVASWTRGAYDGSLHFYADSVRDDADRDDLVAHESLHAQLDAAAPSAPLWLHEGLAQHFTGPPHEGQHRRYRMMVDQQTWIPFESLDGSFQVIDDPVDAGLAYHQSRAMVELLVRREGEAVIARAVAFLAGGGAPAELLAHLGGGVAPTGRDLLDHLRETTPAPP